MLFARRDHQALALACSAPWLKGSAGYVGSSDGWQDLSRHKRLTWEYDRAEDGNVALTGEVDLGACGGVFVLALGFGPDPAEAGHRALASLLDDPDGLQTGIHPRLAGLAGDAALPEAGRRQGRPRPLPDQHGRRADPRRRSASRAAIIASLSTPWGESRGDETKERGTGGYHLVWPRDLVESAGGLLAAGARSEAVRVLAYLRATQMADGHWPQNMWVSGARFWTGIQLGETAFPILLVDLLRRDGALPPEELARFWPMVRRAVSYIVRSGPSTQQDRWENQPGYTPFTLAAVIAALLVAADLADDQGEPAVGDLSPGDRRRLERRHRELALRHRHRPGPPHRGRRLLRAEHPARAGRGVHAADRLRHR